MLPIDESACASFCAAVLEANVSGSDVPSATNVMAVMDGMRPMQQPIAVARSPMMAVSAPASRAARRDTGSARCAVARGGWDGDGSSCGAATPLSSGATCTR
eukprot:281187-Prymnesium_polylepis.1